MRNAKMRNNVSRDDYPYFLKVARLGSLKAVSESLKVNYSTVLSRYLDGHPSGFEKYPENQSVHGIHA